MVLVVDDVPRNIQIVGNILKHEGYAISFANSGKKAIEHARNNAYDLILLDIMMPEMNGFEVSEKLKQHPDTSEVPIIFLTAKTDADSITKAFEVGGVDYITKPFNSRELLARVSTHIRLKKREEEQQALNATKDKFFSIIAHDLKNPFNALLGYSELLLRKLPEFSYEKLQEMVNTIYASSRKTYDLLENLLIWSRTQTNRINYNPAALNAATLARESFGVHKDAAAYKGIGIKEAIEEDVMVHADYGMITLVIRNLVSNAIKFTREGGEIRIEIVSYNSDQALFCVHDDGVGIPEDKLDKLFNIDESYSTKGTGEETGTGLGLILCKEFVQKHNGQIWAESNQEKGSSFCFILQKAKEKPAETADKANSKLIEDLENQILKNEEYRETATMLFEAGKEVNKGMNIKAIQGFASTIIEYGNHLSSTTLTAYGKALEESAENFDIQSIRNLLNAFQQQ